MNDIGLGSQRRSADWVGNVRNGFWRVMNDIGLESQRISIDRVGKGLESRGRCIAGSDGSG